MDKLEELRKKIDDAIIRKQFGDAFNVALKQLFELFKGTQQALTQGQKNEFDRIETALETALSSFRNETQSGLSEASKKQEEKINKALFTIESLVAEAQAKIDEVRHGEDGEDADEEVIVEKVLSRIPTPELPTIPDLSEDVEELEKKVEDIDKRLSNVRTAPFIGPSRGIFLYINGVKKGLVNSLDIIGTGVAYAVTNGQATITITGGSGGSSIEIPSGTVNGVNTSFTVTNTPLYLIWDGQSKFENVHYTRSGGTITITDGAPPVQFIRSIF